VRVHVNGDDIDDIADGEVQAVDLRVTMSAKEHRAAAMYELAKHRGNVLKRL
jgi:hypothetical protein